MKFSAINIKNQQFSNSLRGYDKDEVKLFLERIADEYERLCSENDELKKDNERLQARIHEYRKIEKNLQDTLLKAQESSSRSVESAKKQSALIIKEAELKAAQMVEKAKQNADDIRNSVLRLREEKNLLIARLKAFVGTQSRLLELVGAEEDESPRDKALPAKTEPSEITAPEKKPEGDINLDKILESLE